MGDEDVPPMDGASPVSPEGPMETPDMGGEQMPPMPEEPMEGGSEIDDLYNSLSDDDKKAAKKYIESMVDKNAEEGEEMPPMETPDMGGEQMPPMQESVIFNKKQIQKLKESFGDHLTDRETEKPLQKKEVKKDNPFNAPKFK